jgi:serine O-acetyltransferase
MFEKIMKQIKSDIRTVKRKDPAARNTLEILLTYSGLHAVLFYRLSHALYVRRLYTLARLISQIARFITGVEIHPGAKIGRGLFIDHGSGVVIGETAEIGNNCLIYQGVTLGGTGKERGKRHPTLGNNVMVGAGARVLGPFHVGNNVKIAANAVVLESIPDNCTAVGVPAKIVKRNGVRVNNNSDLDQVHIPDPVSQELCKHSIALERLQKRIDQIETVENAKAVSQREPKKTSKKKDL